MRWLPDIFRCLLCGQLCYFNDVNVPGSHCNHSGAPRVQLLSRSSVLVEWDGLPAGHYILECCHHDSGSWVTVGNGPIQGLSKVVHGLDSGEEYSFRVNSGHPSTPVIIPAQWGSSTWQQEQFLRRYVELEELGRGRFSVVRRARDRGTSQEVAVKQVLARRQSHNVTQAEYALMARLQHSNIVRALALFTNAPQPCMDTIVMELWVFIFIYLYGTYDHLHLHLLVHVIISKNALL